MIHDEINNIIKNAYSNIFSNTIDYKGSLILINTSMHIEELFSNSFSKFYHNSVMNHIDNCLDKKLSNKESVLSMIQKIINKDDFINKLIEGEN